MKHRRFAALLAVLVLLLSVAGCSKKKSDETDPKPAASAQTETPAPAPAEDEPEIWETVYAALLSESDAYSYLLYDLDDDFSPELFVKEGNSEADYYYRVYTVAEDAARELACFPGGHTVICAADAPNTFLTYSGHMGEERLRLCSLENDDLKREDIYFCISYYVEEYLPVEFIAETPLTDTIELQWNPSPSTDTLLYAQQARLDESQAAYDLLGEEEYARLTAITGAMTNASSALGGVKNFDGSVNEDRLLFLLTYLLSDTTSEVPALQTVRSDENGSVYTVSKADMDSWSRYFFGSAMEHEASAQWSLAYNIEVGFENDTYTYTMPVGNFNIGGCVNAITNMVNIEEGRYILTLETFSTTYDAQSDTAMTYAEMAADPSLSPVPYLTAVATVCEQDGQYRIENIRFPNV